MVTNFTSGRGNPEKRFPSVHPWGTDTPSSYSAGSHLAKALLEAPRDGFLLSEAMEKQQRVGAKSWWIWRNMDLRMGVCHGWGSAASL